MFDRMLSHGEYLNPIPRLDGVAVLYQPLDAFRPWTAHHGISNHTVHYRRRVDVTWINDT